MKIIHCSDLHLDSKLSSNLGGIIAKKRCGEILHTFKRMVDYASKNNISAILISGDMFDIYDVTLNTKETVLHAITSNPQINFYYLKGNHDINTSFLKLVNVPNNLKMFGSHWRTYEESKGQITISGFELSTHNFDDAYSSLVLDQEKFNIVMLHGWALDSPPEKKSDIIHLNKLRNKNIDYLALGHIHSYRKHKLDRRGIYCYSGCLEGRGFDECGDCGFVLLDVDETTKKFNSTFIPFAKRKLYQLNVNLTNCKNTAEMIDRTCSKIQESKCNKDSMIKIILQGELDVNCIKDVIYLQVTFDSEFYFTKIVDRTTYKVANTNIDINKDVGVHAFDRSLKGEFIRQVENDSTLSKEDKAEIIHYGIQALAGEEI